MSRTCRYRDCAVDLDAAGKRATAKFCSDEHKRAEHAAKQEDAYAAFWGALGRKPRTRPAVRS